MERARIKIRLFFLICTFSVILGACTPPSPEPEIVDNTPEYFTEGGVVCGSVANLGVIYEGAWVYVESRPSADGRHNLDRLVKYDPAENKVSSLCLDPDCLHMSEECLLCAPNTWIVSYFEIFGDLMMYTFMDFFADLSHTDEIDAKRTYLYNLKTGENRELHGRTADGVIVNTTTANYVMGGKIYSARLEQNYTGREEYNAAPHRDPFKPETHQYIEVYDPQTQTLELMFETREDLLFAGMSNKRFFFKDDDDCFWSCDYKGENMKLEHQIDFDLLMLCGKYAYPAINYDYIETGYNMRVYDITTDSIFNIDLGFQIRSALVDSGRLCVTTTSRIDEFKEFVRDKDAYLSKLYPDVTETGAIAALEASIRSELEYGGKMQIYLTDAMGKNKQLVFEGENMKFTPLRMSDGIVFGFASYADPENGFAISVPGDSGRCMIDLDTGEVIPIPYLEIDERN